MDKRKQKNHTYQTASGILYVPLNGSIRIGSANLNECNLGWWRNKYYKSTGLDFYYTGTKNEDFYVSLQ
ncbi:hypothetical protein HMPREF9012_0759 [Bacteroidetes bacterium oral taxon 272 str. F0290]|nr:hypothetical protein HMPREF9012_0759 [Bacteroidetes bacterium oral taxon 272 str. F0290]